ncbi:MAG: hypothetical protein ACLP1E_13295 [Acidimicrobiales bacterium]
MVDGSGAVLVFSLGQERLRLRAWGDDSIRVRAGQGQTADDIPGVTRFANSTKWHAQLAY